MKHYTVDNQTKIERAIILASSKFAPLNNLIKPTLLHAIRVGTWLYFHKYDVDIVLAGYLHDIIEDTDVTEKEIIYSFGENCAKIIIANTKNSNISDRKLRNDELIKRCIESGEEAAIVKAVDIIDNYKYYSALEHEAGIDYCKNNITAFKKYFNPAYKDMVFSRLFEEVS